VGEGTHSVLLPELGVEGEGLVHFAVCMNSDCSIETAQCVCAHATWLSSEVKVTDMYV
jgi:hypothetical protein